LKRLRQQSILHPAVVPAGPVFSRQKRPSNFDLRFLRIIPVEPRRPDDSLILFIDHNERATGFQCIFEENSEHIFPVTIALRMLLPNERIRRDRKKLAPIVRRQRPQLDQFAFQVWLKIKRHCICGFATLSDCGPYGMNCQVSFSGVSLFCPPKTITRPNPGEYAIPAPSRGGGDWVVATCPQLPAATNHCHVVFWSTPPLPPPKRITALMFGSKAADAAYTSRG